MELVRNFSFACLFFFYGCGDSPKNEVKIKSQQKIFKISKPLGSLDYVKINDYNIDNYCTENKSFILPEKNKHNSALLIICDDRSGSTSANRKLTLEQYKLILESFNDSYSGVVAVRVIGNPLKDNLEFHRLNLEPFHFSLPVFETIKSKKVVTLSAKEKYKKNKNLVDSLNCIIEKSNTSNIAKFLTVINANVIKYKKAGRDLTDINDALKHINEIISENQFKNYKKIHVIMLSDGIHDSTKQKVCSFNPSRDVQVHLVGWKDKTIFKSPNSYESVDGLSSSLKEIFN